MAAIVIKREFEIDVEMTLKDIQILIKQLDNEDKQKILNLIIIELSLKQPNMLLENLTEVINILKSN